MWTIDDLLAKLREYGAEVGKDNDGQIILYTGYREIDGKLVRMGEVRQEDVYLHD